MQGSSTELDIGDHVRKEGGWMTNLHEIAAILEGTRSTQIGDREGIGSGSANGVDEEEDTRRVLVEFGV